jgi:methyl-accepting chemotaxis protein
LRRINESVHRYDELCAHVAGNSSEQYEALSDSLGRMRNIVANAAQDLREGLSDNGSAPKGGSQKRALRGLIDELVELAAEEAAHAQDSGMRKFADEAKTAIHQFVETVDYLKTSGDHISTRFDAMRENVEAVNGMIGEVGQINRQTELLALNAAIEAARAGEAGRGFAVVADEVRKLAQRTEKFSDEISGRLQGIQGIIDEVGAVVEVTSSTDITHVRTSESHVAAMAEEINERAARANQHASRINDISESIRAIIMQDILSLQFEDLVSQLLDRVHRHTDSMSRFSSGFFDLHRDIEERDGVTRINRRNQLLQVLLNDAQHARSAINLDMAQSATKPGSIQMF